MQHTLVLNLPEGVFRRLQHTAEAVGRSVQEVAVDNLAGEPLSLEPDLEEPYRSELIGMAIWSDEALNRTVAEVMPRAHQRRHEALLSRLRERELTRRERSELDALREEADRVMLRKARAAALLHGRGRPVPAPGELPSPR